MNMQARRPLSFLLLSLLLWEMIPLQVQAERYYEEDPIDTLFGEDDYVGPGSYRRRHRRDYREGIHDEPDIYITEVYCEREQPTDWGGILGGIAAIGAAVAPAAAMYFSNREWARTIKGVNRDWSNARIAQFNSLTEAYTAGVNACNLRYDSALQYTIDYGAAPMSPRQMATFCNGAGYEAFAGLSGLYGNGVGGAGNPYVNAGYSPQFLAMMAGPYGSYQYPFNTPGHNPFGNPYWGTYPPTGWYPGGGTSGMPGLPGGQLITPGGLPFFSNGLPMGPNYQYGVGAGYIPYGMNGYGSYYYASGAGGGGMYPTYGANGGPYQCLGSSCLFGNPFQQNQALYGQGGLYYNFSSGGFGASPFAAGNLGLQFR